MSLVELPVVSPPNAAASALDLVGLQQLLRQSVAGEIRFDRLSRALYSTDASVYQIIPVGVVVPTADADVIAAVHACQRFGVPLTVRGGGTSQAGQAIGPGLQLDCSKYLNQILEVRPEVRWARVQPGCILDDLNQELKAWGLHFAPDVSTSNRATIGGMIANNSSGAHSVIYGKTLDHVLELRVVLADGSVIQLGPLTDEELADKCGQRDREGEGYRAVRRLAAEHANEIERRFPKILRRVGGYNLDSFARPEHPFSLVPLLVGAEGTLGIILEAKLRLTELPAAKALLVVHFHDLLAALAAAPAILRHRPAAVEVVDKYVLDSTRLNPEAARLCGFIHGDPGAIFIIELFDEQQANLPRRLHALAEELQHAGIGYHWHATTDPAEQARIWKLRRAALGLSMAQKGDAKALSFVEDTAVAPERLRDYIAEFLAIVARHGTTAGVYAHASVGCLHVRPVINLKTREGVERFERIADDVADLVLKYGGALSGEHGDGLVRSPFQEKMYGSVLYNAFREVKHAFDPHRILNPGKIVDAAPLTANLRTGPAYVTPEVPTTFDFTADGGLARAAELCVGVGACRKRGEGTMCPSFQATRDEQHCTRGRANALRLAITGQLGLQGLGDPALCQVMDLCLECKACKSECPTNVDMARLKAEVLHQYYQVHGLPWRNRLFGHVARLGQLGCRLAPLSNWWARSSAGRWLNERLFGVDSRRVPPRFAARRLRRELATVTARRAPVAGRPTVYLFLDTFARYHEPELAMAILELAQAVDHTFAVVKEDTGCCGRPMISSGMLTDARRQASRVVEVLYPLAAQGNLITTCEPSCILTMRDDYPALVQREQQRRAEVVAAACRTFEEALDQVLEGDGADGTRGPFEFVSAPKKILVQGHCHQRALVGMDAALRLLRRLPGSEVIDLDAGCCGMAGAFGYEKEHYDLSRLVGEQRLFPLLRAAEPDAVVVAPGFSCRLQIEHFTGRAAVHPAQLLHKLMKRSHHAC
jgi:FAD/FMN-containing dehydrogenase/Fe-S oxidoreductase